MKKEQKQLIAVIVLISIAVLLFVKNLFKTRAARNEIGPKSEEKGLLKADVPIGKIDFFNLEQELRRNRQKTEWVRDPFHFPPKKVEGKGDLNLSGIIYDSESPVAVINDTVVHEGDVIDGARVLEISSESVVLEKDGKRYKLELLK